MVRSMYSGVAGMKSHQQRMDVIGNNIANVNTYGFKSSRVTFRDMFYQNIRNASTGTSTRGGVSPSGIGYGSQIASIDKLMTQSSMTSTGQRHYRRRLLSGTRQRRKYLLYACRNARY